MREVEYHRCLGNSTADGLHHPRKLKRQEQTEIGPLRVIHVVMSPRRLLLVNSRKQTLIAGGSSKCLPLTLDDEGTRTHPLEAPGPPRPPPECRHKKSFWG